MKSGVCNVISNQIHKIFLGYEETMNYTIILRCIVIFDYFLSVLNLKILESNEDIMYFSLDNDTWIPRKSFHASLGCCVVVTKMRRSTKIYILLVSSLCIIVLPSVKCNSCYENYILFLNPVDINFRLNSGSIKHCL